MCITQHSWLHQELLTEFLLCTRACPSSPALHSDCFSLSSVRPKLDLISHDQPSCRLCGCVSSVIHNSVLWGEASLVCLESTALQLSERPQVSNTEPLVCITQHSWLHQEQELSLKDLCLAHKHVGLGKHLGMIIT